MKRSLALSLLVFLLGLLLPLEALALLSRPPSAVSWGVPYSAKIPIAEDTWQEAAITLEIGSLGAEPRHGLFCGNDPVNRHDPLGLADQYTVAQADNVETLLLIAAATGDLVDDFVATSAENALLSTLSRDPEPWARSVYLNGGAAGLARYVGERDRILGETFQMGGTGLFYGGAGLRVIGGAAEVVGGAAFAWSTGGIGGGIGLAVMGGNGVDNIQAGWRTITSGEYQPAWLEGKMSGPAYFVTQLGIAGMPAASRYIGPRLAPEWNLANYHLTTDAAALNGSLGWVKAGIAYAPVPGVRNGAFAQWFDTISPTQFEKLWADPKIQKVIKRRLREPGGMHEWHMVARAPKFKRWGITAQQIADMRTAIANLKFKNPTGFHGSTGSTTWHNELLDLIDTAGTYDDFVIALRAWASNRLIGGAGGLPPGLRP